MTDDKAGLFTCRFFLGLAEGGLLPGIVLYLSQFYTRSEYQTRVGLFWAAASIAGAFGGLLAAALGNMAGLAHLNGWNWIFIIEGILTTLMGASGYFFVTSTADSSRWLTENEKTYQRERLIWHGQHKTDVVIVGRHYSIDMDNSFSWTIVRSVFADPMLYALSILAFFSGCNIYTMAYFLPTIVSGLGPTIASTTAIAQLLTVPPYALAVVATIGLCLISDKYHFRFPQLLIPGLVGIAGMAILYSVNSIPARYAAIHLAVPAVYAPVPAYIAFTSSNFAGYYRRATALGFVLAISNCGSLLSVWLFRAAEAPNYKTAYQVNLIFLCLFVVLATGIELYYRGKNNARALLIRENRMEEYPKGNGDRHVLFAYVL